MYQYNNLDDFVAYGKTLTISYQNLSLTEIFDDIKFPMFNIIQDYIEELKDEAITITFTDKEYYKYKYKPRLLSAYLYGSTEFFPIILQLNDIASEKEFTKKSIKLIPADTMKSLLEKIYIAEQNYLTSYNSRRFKEYMEEQNS